MLSPPNTHTYQPLQPSRLLYTNEPGPHSSPCEPLDSACLDHRPTDMAGMSRLPRSMLDWSDGSHATQRSDLRYDDEKCEHTRSSCTYGLKCHFEVKRLHRHRNHVVGHEHDVLRFSGQALCGATTSTLRYKHGRETIQQQ